MIMMQSSELRGGTIALTFHPSQAENPKKVVRATASITPTLIGRDRCISKLMEDASKAPGLLISDAGTEQ